MVDFVEADGQIGQTHRFREVPLDGFGRRLLREFVVQRRTFDLCPRAVGHREALALRPKFPLRRRLRRGEAAAVPSTSGRRCRIDRGHRRLGRRQIHLASDVRLHRLTFHAQLVVGEDQGGRVGAVRTRNLHRRGRLGDVVEHVGRDRVAQSFLVAELWRRRAAIDDRLVQTATCPQQATDFGHSYDSTAVRLLIEGHSGVTGAIRSDVLLFIYLGRSAAYRRNVGRRMVVSRSNCSRVDVES